MSLTAVSRAGRGGATDALYSQEARRRRGPARRGKLGVGRVGLQAGPDAIPARRRSRSSCRPETPGP